jgi:hypothetical protein
MHAEKDASPRREEVDDCRLMRENCWGFGWGERRAHLGELEYYTTQAAVEWADFQPATK